MKPKDTEKLLELLKKSGSIDAYLQENKDFLLDCEIKEYLNTLKQKKGYTVAQIAKRAELSEPFCHQFLSPKNPRLPSRETLLSFCIGMQLNLDEIQTALRIAKFALLYPKDERDSILIYGIAHQKSVPEINELLYDHQLKCLCEK